MSISTSTSTEGGKAQPDKIDAKDDSGKDSAPNVEIPNAHHKEIGLYRIEKSEDIRPTGMVVVPETELDFDGKLRKKKKTGGLEKNFKLDITEVVLKDKIAMTDRPENMDKQEMTAEEDISLIENKVTSDNILPLITENITPLAQTLRKIAENRSSSAGRLMDIEKKVLSATSAPIPGREIEEVVNESETVENAHIVPRYKSSSSLPRTLSRASSRMSRVSRSLRQLMCCGITMEASSEDQLPARDQYHI